MRNSPLLTVSKQKMITAKINKARAVEDLEYIFNTHSYIGGHNASLIFYRLAMWNTTSPIKLTRFITNLLVNTAVKISAFSPNDLVTTLWSISMLEDIYSKDDLIWALESISQVISERLDEFTSEELCSIIWIMAKCRYQYPAIRTVEKISSGVTFVSINALVNALQGLAFSSNPIVIADQTVIRFIDEVLARCEATENLSSDIITTVLWSMAMFNIKYPITFMRLAEKLQKQKDLISIADKMTLEIVYLYLNMFVSADISAMISDAVSGWPSHLVIASKKRDEIVKFLVSRGINCSLSISGDILPADVYIIDQKEIINYEPETSYMLRSSQQTGSVQLKNNLFNALGWKVTVIPYWVKDIQAFLLMSDIQ